MKGLLVFLFAFISICLACSTSSSCGCGGRCDIGDGVCSSRGPNCGGSTPICISNSRSCVQCDSDHHCGGANRFCIWNSCKQCRGVSDCASDSNCNAVCSGNNCHVNSNLNCVSQGQRCIIGQARCVDCLSNSDCPGSKPYCDAGGTHTCHQCLATLHCQSDRDCTATCHPTNRTCVSGSPVVDCSSSLTNPFCRKDTSTCVRCLTHGHCGNELFLKKCRGDTNDCHQCSISNDCRYKGNCNAACVNTSSAIHICQNQDTPLICCFSECNLKDGVCLPGLSYQLMPSFALLLMIAFIYFIC